MRYGNISFKGHGMNNLNSVLIEGNLVKDPKSRTVEGGSKVCNFTIACNRYFKGKDGYEKFVDFIEIEAWNQVAETCIKQGYKGRGVRIVGRLKQDRWTGVNGTPYNKLKVVAEHVEFRFDAKKNTNNVPAEAVENPASEEVDGQTSFDIPF